MSSKNEDLLFWLHRTEDHGEFLQVLLLPPKYKRLAGNFKESFGKISTNGKELTKISDEWKSFLNKLITVQTEGEFIGNVYPSFLLHLAKEHELLEHFASGGSVNNALRLFPPEEHHKEEVEVLEKLMDPTLSKTDLLTMAKEFELTFSQFVNQPKSQSEISQLVYLSEQLVQFCDELPQSKIIASPKLVHHIQREIEWYNSKLEELNVKSTGRKI